MFDPGRNYKKLYGEPMIDVKGTFPDTFSILLEMQDSSNGAPGEGKLAVHCSQYNLSCSFFLDSFFLSFWHLSLIPFIIS